MASKDVAILDFGSQKITVVVGCRDVNNTINVKAFYEEAYEGFMDGEFIEPSNLDTSIARAIAGAERICNCKLTDITIGVPTEFCFAMCKNVSQSFLKPKKIKIWKQKRIFPWFPYITFYLIISFLLLLLYQNYFNFSREK